MNDKTKFTFIDLFSGIGGFRLALESVGGCCIGFSEINTDAINTYTLNFSEKKELNLGDITKIHDLPPHDLLTAGVPCQSWSIAGKNLGFDDDRGQLWNDTIYLLNKTKPKAFIFENVKGLADPRNKDALAYIMERIKDAGYHANYYILNSFDYGVPQSRVRIYITGFLEARFHDTFSLPEKKVGHIRLKDIIKEYPFLSFSETRADTPTKKQGMSLSNNNNGHNDYFLFNDLRDGDTTIHSWDILETTERQKQICLLLLKNRRKKLYGNLDGNPLSITHLQNLDTTITLDEINDLININILKPVYYSFKINKKIENLLSDNEQLLLSHARTDIFSISDLKTKKILKNIKLSEILASLREKSMIDCIEVRYDFKNSKISTGLFGINRIFLLTSNIFPTLVASDSNDYISTHKIEAKNKEEYKQVFIKEVYQKKNFRKIEKEEACLIQGFPKTYQLSDNRAVWMRLIGNSVSVPVIKLLADSIIKTGVFNSQVEKSIIADEHVQQNIKTQVIAKLPLFPDTTSTAYLSTLKNRINHEMTRT